MQYRSFTHTDSADQKSSLFEGVWKARNSFWIRQCWTNIRTKLPNENRQRLDRNNIPSCHNIIKVGGVRTCIVGWICNWQVRGTVRGERGDRTEGRRTRRFPFIPWFTCYQLEQCVKTNDSQKHKTNAK